MRILHGMSDVCGQGSFSANGLNKLGQKAQTVIRTPDDFGCKYDISLNISSKKSLMLWDLIKMLGFSAYAFFKYNVYHFHFTHSLFPHCFDMKILRLFGKKVFMEYHGSDIRWTYNREIPKYWPFEDLPEKSDMIKKLNKRVSENVDGIILHDNELRKHLYNPNQDVYIIPLRADIQRFTPSYPDVNCKKPVIVHAPSNPIIKGTQYILEAIEHLKEKYDFDFILVEGMKQEEAFEVYKKADIIIDQLIIGTYGVFAIEAMSMGKPVITYLSDDMVDQFPTDLPIENANIENIESVIEGLLLNPEKRHDLGARGRKYAEDYHDYNVIAKAQLMLYEGKYPPMSQRDSFAFIKSLKEGNCD